MAKKRPKAPNHGREECYVETNSGIALVARTFPFFSRSNACCTVTVTHSICSVTSQHRCIFLNKEEELVSEFQSLVDWHRFIEDTEVQYDDDGCIYGQ